MWIWTDAMLFHRFDSHYYVNVKLYIWKLFCEKSMSDFNFRRPKSRKLIYNGNLATCCCLSSNKIDSSMNGLFRNRWRRHWWFYYNLSKTRELSHYLKKPLLLNIVKLECKKLLYDNRPNFVDTWYSSSCGAPKFPTSKIIL